MSDGTQGTVFDIGYQRYEGPREGRRRSRAAVFTDGVRTALGLGRGGRAKILPWLFIGILNLIALILAMMAGTLERVGGPGAVEQSGLPSHGDFYGIAAFIVFVFAAVIAPELLCRDRREGTINLYLVRPLTGTDYVASRWAAFLGVMLFALWVPQLVLFVGLTMGHPTPLDYLMESWPDVPRFLLAGLAMAAYMTTLALLVASFTTRRAFAAVFLVGLFFISTTFTTGLSLEVGGDAGRWISMFNLTNIPLHVNDLIFGEVGELTEGAPAGEFEAPVLLWWYVAWTLLPAAWLWARYRRMTP